MSKALTEEEVQTLREEIQPFLRDYKGEPVTKDQDSYWYDLLLGYIKRIASVDFEFLEKDGGGEGGAEDCSSVFRWKDKFYMATYRYYSHYGYEWDYLTYYEVVPSQKTITVYN